MKWVWILIVLALLSAGSTLASPTPRQAQAVTTWIPFTPTWSSFKDPQPQLGNGTLSGRYNVVGTTWTIQWQFVFGSTTTYSPNANINVHYLTFPPGFTTTVEQVAPAIYGEIYGVQFQGKAWLHPEDRPPRLYLTWPVQGRGTDLALSHLWGTGTGMVGTSPAPPHAQEDIIVTATFVGS